MNRPDVAFELWRQDDNGRRYLVGRHATLAEAERRLAELTRTPHKQTYWISAVTATPHGTEAT